MTKATLAAQFTAALWECDRHCAALVEALDEWRALPTPNVVALESERSWRHLTDRILYRLTKLQDAVGERLLPATLGCLQEPYEIGRASCRERVLWVTGVQTCALPI